MSKNTNEDTPQQTSATTASAATSARKRASKKVAVNAIAEPAAELATKKKVVRKVVAKKIPIVDAPAKEVTAKKTARKSPATSSTPDLPFDLAPISKPVVASKKAAAPRAVKIPRLTKSVPKIAPETTAVADRDSQSSELPPRRFGRVPGGGPTVQRETESLPVAPRESIPFPQPVAAESSRKNVQQDDSPRDPQRREQPPREGQPRNSPPNRDPQGQPRNTQNSVQDGPQTSESRSKRRREKRKRRNQERNQQGAQPAQAQQNPPNRQRSDSRNQQSPGRPKPFHAPQHDSEERRPAVQLDGPKIEGDGMLELSPKGFGFLRLQRKNFEQARDDIFVTPETIRKYNLRLGQWIHGLYQEGPRGSQLVEITKINDLTPEEASKLPHFDELKAINPTRRISFETTPERFTTRVVDIMAPVGRGQRGLIVSPPRSGVVSKLMRLVGLIALSSSK